MEEIQYGRECGDALLGMTFYVSSLRGEPCSTWQSHIESGISPRRYRSLGMTYLIYHTQ